jgi:hypothetical protein
MAHRMTQALGHISGTAYRTKDGTEELRSDPKGRNLYIGQRDASYDPSAMVLLGKVAERSSSADRFDYNTWLDVTFPHVILICGRRGSGKSYDLGIIAEGLSARPDSNFSSVQGDFCTVLFDLQSQFWTLGQPLDGQIKADADQIALVKQWNVSGSVTPAQILLPEGSAAITGSETKFVISPSMIELADWLALLKIERFDPMGQLLRNCIQLARLSKAQFELSDLVLLIRGRSAHADLAGFQSGTADALEWRLLALQDLKLFKQGSSIVDLLLKPRQASVLLLRELDETVKSVIVASTMRQIERAMSRFHQKLKVANRKREPSTGQQLPSRAWVLIDEAHLVCPSDRSTPANEVIVDYVKRGRDAGLSLVLATQQPSALDTSAISQVDLSLIHRLTYDADIAAALQRLPSPMPKDMTIAGKDISDPRILIRRLAPGECLVSDAEAPRTFIMRSRPRLCPHGGGEPVL